jgi:hypothetical protein
MPAAKVGSDPIAGSQIKLLYGVKNGKGSSKEGKGVSPVTVILPFALKPYRCGTLCDEQQII